VQTTQEQENCRARQKRRDPVNRARRKKRMVPKKGSQATGESKLQKMKTEVTKGFLEVAISPRAKKRARGGGRQHEGVNVQTLGGGGYSHPKKKSKKRGGGRIISGFHLKDRGISRANEGKKSLPGSPDRTLAMRPRCQPQNKARAPQKKKRRG